MALWKTLLAWLTLSGTLYHTVWKEMYYAGGTGMPLQIAVVAQFSTFLEGKQEEGDSSVVQLQWSASQREKVT